MIETHWIPMLVGSCQGLAGNGELWKNSNINVVEYDTTLLKSVQSHSSLPKNLPQSNLIRGILT